MELLGEYKAAAKAVAQDLRDANREASRIEKSGGEVTPELRDRINSLQEEKSKFQNLNEIRNTNNSARNEGINTQNKLNHMASGINEIRRVISSGGGMGLKDIFHYGVSAYNTAESVVKYTKYANVGQYLKFYGDRYRMFSQLDKVKELPMAQRMMGMGVVASRSIASAVPFVGGVAGVAYATISLAKYVSEEHDKSRTASAEAGGNIAALTSERMKSATRFGSYMSNDELQRLLSVREDSSKIAYETAVKASHWQTLREYVGIGVSEEFSKRKEAVARLHMGLIDARHEFGRDWYEDVTGKGKFKTKDENGNDIELIGSAASRAQYRDRLDKYWSNEWGQTRAQTGDWVDRLVVGPMYGLKRIGIWVSSPFNYSNVIEDEENAKIQEWQTKELESEKIRRDNERETYAKGVKFAVNRVLQNENNRHMNDMAKDRFERWNSWSMM
jgi:hypothetical protein